MKWQRITPFESNITQQEIWICENINYKKKYNVEVTHGKKIDIFSLKINLIENFAKKVSSTKNSRISLYKSKDNLEIVSSCPVCDYPSDSAKEILNIYGAVYYQCRECFHYYLLYRPTEKYLKEFYKNNVEYQSTYSDKRTLETRVEQVVIPKAEYVIQQYERIYGRPPRSIMDVGAGSGHFVYACQKLGVHCEGIEISESGRAFCKDNFNIELFDVDFLREAQRFNCDIVSFFGLIEHVSSPIDMLKSSISALNKEGMVIADVPRWDSFSTAVHCAFPDSVIRHLDPMDHIQCFSDSSLATAFNLSGYDIVAAWYFGMDAYELATQLSYISGDNNVLESLKEKIPLFQKTLDLAKLSDFTVFVGVPAQ
ncbi:class I SAM-dependent methyltransferase [Thermodesulfobacteriota bacterium]